MSCAKSFTQIEFARIFAVGQPPVKSPAIIRVSVYPFALRVECGGDFCFRRALVIFRENITDDFGLCLVNSNFVNSAFFALSVGVYKLIAENELTARISAVFNASINSV